MRESMAVLAAAAILSSAAPAQRTPSVKDVMKRVGAYVDSYGARASIVVGTEHYSQDALGNTAAPHGQRATVAEFAIVKVDEIMAWQGFRDVIEVDGEPLADRDDRLVQALLAGPGGFIQARRLSDESARFNIGNIERNFNIPTAALFFFRTDHHERFKFTARDVTDGAWHLAWRETSRPTFIRSLDGRSLPSEGEMWVDPSDGTIRRTILRMEIKAAEGRRVNGSVDVTYRLVDHVGMWLPSAMEESWETKSSASGWERVRGRASYSNYRQFTTSVRIK